MPNQPHLRAARRPERHGAVLRLIDNMVMWGGPNPFLTQDLRAILARDAHALLKGQEASRLERQFIRRFDRLAKAWSSAVFRPGDETGREKLRITRAIAKKAGILKDLSDLTSDSLWRSLDRLETLGHLIRVEKGKYLRSPALGLVQLLTENPRPWPQSKVRRWPLVFQDPRTRFPPLGMAQRIPHFMRGLFPSHISPESYNLPDSDSISETERKLLESAADLIQLGALAVSYVQGGTRGDVPFAVLVGGSGNGFAASLRKSAESRQAYEEWLQVLGEDLKKMTAAFNTNLVNFPLMGLHPLHGRPPAQAMKGADVSVETRTGKK